MSPMLKKLLFDKKDFELLGMVQHVLDRESSRRSFDDLLNPYLNPHGIKEMAASQGFRIAHAMINLLHSLEIGKADDRLSSLNALHAEVTNITHSSLRMNTARVLLQIMKELVREQGDHARQLELAHDFRMAVFGKPRFIRSELMRYHLLEMPEEWNQITFDDHVHDANTKGRKTPTHLIMDAWIKGIRRLTVIYYNFVSAEAAAELLKAGEIMGISIRIGVSMGAQFRGAGVRFIWIPRGFCDAKDFLSFLADSRVEALMDEGRKISQRERHHVIDVLDVFNAKYRPIINEEFGIDLETLKAIDFLSFVADGQASLLHLSEFIHTSLLPLLKSRVGEIRDHYKWAVPDDCRRLEKLVENINEFDAETILGRFLIPAYDASLRGQGFLQDTNDVSRLFRASPRELLEMLDHLHSGNRICLNLSGLRVEDVLEMLYDCQGMITHLEIFNLKDHVDGKTSHYGEISELQSAINEGNVITLKRIILSIRLQLEQSEEPDQDRCKKITEILCNIPALQSPYRAVPLGSYIGSDSTGRSSHRYGMGFVVPETLTRRAQNAAQDTLGPKVFILPVRMTVYLRKTFMQSAAPGSLRRWIQRMTSLVPGFRSLGEQCRHDWEIRDNATRLETPGNIIPLGGVHQEGDNELRIEEKKSHAKAGISWRYMNSAMKNAIKVLTGFIPAFLTFALTKDWWLLAYGGAFIWFGITGFRNVLQSVLGGGGFRRSPLLRWNDYVSWGRLTDSLLFTGFSVPLLDYVVKTIVLDRTFGITTATNSPLLYAAIALANGLYLSSHNAFRGLPRGAIFGNFFRSILSIPLALVFNAAVGGLLMGTGIQDISTTLQKWAAVISKAASDCVAGLIEGLADRYDNIKARKIDYAAKLCQLFDTYARLELLFPERDVIELLESSQRFMQTVNAEVRELERIISINSLDLLYFWMYQPRARSVLGDRVRSMSNEERQCFLRSQFILQRETEISQLFLDGVIGKNFSKGLAFYLRSYQGYLDALEEMIVGATPCRQTSHRRGFGIEENRFSGEGSRPPYRAGEPSLPTVYRPSIPGSPYPLPKAVQHAANTITSSVGTVMR